MVNAHALSWRQSRETAFQFLRTGVMGHVVERPGQGKGKGPSLACLSDLSLTWQIVIGSLKSHSYGNVGPCW